MSEEIPITTIARVFETAVFDSEDTKITKGTLQLSSEYLKMFIREAILRANEDREAKIKNGEEEDDKVLDVQHLENISGLLVMDF